MKEKETYFDYVENVLGVSSLLLSADPKKAVELLILVEGYSAYSAPEKDLLGKMISALKIDLGLIQVTDLENAARFQPRFTVEFVDSPFKESLSTSVKTHSPRVLLKTPDLKKSAWDDLQKVIQFFKAGRG